MFGEHEGPDPAAGREAEVVLVRVSQVAHARGGQPLEQGRLRALDLEQAPLGAAAAQRVPAEVPVALDHPVARDQERNGVLRERGARGADRVGMPDLAGDPAVGTHFTRRDLERLGQNGALELGQSAQVEAQVAPPLALQVADERAHLGRRHRLLGADRAAEPLAEAALEGRRGARPRHHRDARLAVGDVHRTERRLQAPVPVDQADAGQDGRQQPARRLLPSQTAERPAQLQGIAHRFLRRSLHGLTPARRDSVIDSRSALIARCTLDFVVPRGCFRIAATSSSFRPSTYRRISGAR